MNSKLKIIDTGLQMAAASEKDFPVLSECTFICVNDWIVFKEESLCHPKLVEVVQEYLKLTDCERKQAMDAFQGMPEMLELAKVLNSIIRLRREWMRGKRHDRL